MVPFRLAERLGESLIQLVSSNPLPSTWDPATVRQKGTGTWRHPPILEVSYMMRRQAENVNITQD